MAGGWEGLHVTTRPSKANLGVLLRLASALRAQIHSAFWTCCLLNLSHSSLMGHRLPAFMEKPPVGRLFAQGLQTSAVSCSSSTERGRGARQET